MVIETPDDLLAFIENGTVPQNRNRYADVRSVFSYLASLHVEYGSIGNSHWTDRISDEILNRLDNAVGLVVDPILRDIPAEVIVRNPGIDPRAMHQLFEYFQGRDGPIEDLIPADPASDDATTSYARVFGRLANTNVAAALGPAGKPSFRLALLVTRWMRGYPLARLIADRIKNNRERNVNETIAVTIRNVMTDVEQVARFEAPRGLGCYCDILRVFLQRVGRNELAAELQDYGVFLELGVNQTTQVSLIGLGLSRTSTVMLSDLIVADSLSEDEALMWLLENRDIWANSDLPELVKAETLDVMKRLIPDLAG